MEKPKYTCETYNMFYSVFCPAEAVTCGHVWDFQFVSFECNALWMAFRFLEISYGFSECAWRWPHVSAHAFQLLHLYLVMYHITSVLLSDLLNTERTSSKQSCSSIIIFACVLIQRKAILKELLQFLVHLSFARQSVKKQAWIETYPSTHDNSPQMTEMSG